MPQPIVVQNDGLARGMQGAVDFFGQMLMNRAMEQRQSEKLKTGASTLGAILKTLPENPTLPQIQNAITSAMEQGVPQELIKQQLDLYAPMLKQQAETTATMSLLDKYAGMDKNILPSQTQRIDYSAEGPMSSALMQGTEQRISPISSIKQVQAFARAPDDLQKSFIQKNGGINNLSNDQLKILSIIPNKGINNLVDTELKIRDQEQRAFKNERQFNQKGADEAEKNASILRNSIRPKEMSLRLAEEAINTGETGPFSLANLAQRTGLHELTNAAGTELNQAGKEFFIGTLGKVSAKAQNQWLEQRIAQLFAQVGDPRINALMKTTMLKGEIEANKEYLKEYDRIAEEDMQKYGYVKKDIEKRAFNASEEAHNKIMNKLSFKTRQLYEQEKGAKWLMEHSKEKVPQGTMATPEMIKIFLAKYDGNRSKAIENAKKLGYTIPSKSEMEEYATR